METLIDSHAHLDFLQFKGSLQATVERALKGGVEKIITVGIDEKSSKAAQEIAQKFPGMVYPTLGLHPHDAKELSIEVEDRLREAAKGGGFIAIGETGLDYAKEYSPRNSQKKAFLFQIELAVTYGLPLIIHTRDAEEDTVGILKELSHTPVKGVIHCFSGGKNLFETALELGFYISCSGIITFKNAKEVRALVAECPLDRLLIETDSPFLAPVPHRGKTNEPLFVKYVAHELARIKSVDVKEVAKWTTRNAKALFDRLNP